jgi:hypothetical protein
MGIPSFGDSEQGGEESGHNWMSKTNFDGTNLRIWDKTCNTFFQQFVGGTILVQQFIGTELRAIVEVQLPHGVAEAATLAAVQEGVLEKKVNSGTLNFMGRSQGQAFHEERSLDDHPISRSLRKGNYGRQRRDNE